MNINDQTYNYDSSNNDDTAIDNPAFWPVLTGVTPQTLIEKSSKERERVSVIAFYQDRKGNPWREFSNWYTGKNHGFDFVLPVQLLELSGATPSEYPLFPPIVHCEQSEKAIMLCKAACMGDSRSYAAIAASTTPKEAKLLGRQVRPWDAVRWSSVVCGVAVAVLRQKFAVPHMREILLSTGNKILCEATAGDRTWAIGISIKMPKVYEVPARWKGSNVLGWALMEVRSIIRAEEGQVIE